METKGEEGSFTPIFVVLIVSIAIASFWDKFPIIKNSVHLVLNPTAGILLNWNITYGMMLIVLIITFLTTLIQKYATDQETLRELKKEQKELQKKSQEFKNHPEKMMEIQKEIFPLTMRSMKLSMRPIIFTGVPFILFFRWFMDVFTALGNPKFFGFLTWFWFYLIFTLIFSSILRKVLKVV